MTAWLDGLTPWMVAAALVAGVVVLVLTALMYRNERRKRPREMPGEFVKRYKRKNIYRTHTYNEWPDTTGSDPTGSDEFFVEHSSRSYSTLEAAREAIRDGSWCAPRR